MNRKYKKKQPVSFVPSQTINRTYKDSLFRMIFGNEKHKKWSLNLYNALANTDYTDPKELEIVTLNNAIYMHMKNDVALLINYSLLFAEHQSTLNPNLPFREFEYCAVVLSDYVAARPDLDPYGSKPIKLPEPLFFVIYNGLQEAEKITTLKLSDLYYNKSEDPMLELRVIQININGYDGGCVQLYEYEWFVETVRAKHETMGIRLAVNEALNEIPQTFTIRDLLLKYRHEVVDMSIFEYDEKRHLNNVRKEALEEGREEGREEGELIGIAKMAMALMRKTQKSFREVILTSEIFLTEEQISFCEDYIAKNRMTE